MAKPASYSDMVARAKAAQAAARGQLGPLNPGGANETTVGGGDAEGAGAAYDGAHQNFSEVVADATLGVDGEGYQPGAPNGQQKTKPKVLGADMSKNESEFKYFAKTEKVEHGVVFGWAIVCKEDGVDYFDLNRDQTTGARKPDHIPEASMLDAACDFAKAERPGNEMHDGPDVGQYLFLFPMTTDIAKALGIVTKKTGLLVGYKPPADVLAKFMDGTYTGFSIEGTRIKDREIADAA